MPLNAGDPDVIGGYSLLDRIGAGGMGVVYLAKSPSGRQVAVKVVHAQLSEDEEFRIRFRQEVTAARKVSGAFTAPVLDADPDAERPWMATLYIPGPTLAEKIADGGPLGGTELRRLALGLAEALRDIHQAGVVHRDLKPANVLMAEDGPRVLDFGISRAAGNQALTMTGRVIGTPPFMSPEQLRSSRDVGPASDVFSLGSLLAFASTGRGPFDMDSPYMTAYQVMHEAPALDAVPEPLRGLITRCLEKEPDRRVDLAELLPGFRMLPEVDETHPGGFVRADVPTQLRSAEEARPGGGPEDGGSGSARPGDGPEDVTAHGAADESRDPGRLRRAVLVSGGTLAVVGLTVAAVFTFGPPYGGRGTTPHAGSGTGSADSGTAELPNGWKAWHTKFTAAPDDGSMAVSPGCVNAGNELYCGGSALTVARIDSSSGKRLWSFKGEVHNELPVGVADSTVIAYAEPTPGSRELVGLDRTTGKRRWAHPALVGMGAAAVHGNAVISISPGDDELVAWEAGTGQERWRMPLPPSRWCGVISGQRLHLECSQAADGAPGDSSVFRIDPRDGSRRLIGQVPTDAASLGEHDGEPLFAVAENAASVTFESTYTALARPREPGDEETRSKLAEPLTGAPTLAGGVLYFIHANGTVTAVSPDSGRRLWSRSTDMESLSAPVAAGHGQALYFCNRYGRVLALDRRDGSPLWRTKPRDGGTPSLIGGTPPTPVLTGAALVGTFGQTLFSISTKRQAERAER